ncbi:MAG: hypothetical protein Q9196_005517 [Gyalolechia fulgens]
MSVRKAEIRGRIKLEGVDENGKVRSEANALEARMDVWFKKFCEEGGINADNVEATGQGDGAIEGNSEADEMQVDEQELGLFLD